jgi:hypothetical protein
MMAKSKEEQRIGNIVAGFGSSGNEYSFCIAFRMPKSVTGNISCKFFH